MKLEKTRGLKELNYIKSFIEIYFNTALIFWGKTSGFFFCS
ncbi:hypothetical protein AAJ76_222000244 [Vairimorpha ceranae]|uniref:Uncharacterized protein n=1 Tax=Vairimorpha ceranae TaxID=40302 RepID=A0A0F9Z7B2_9MICR|nr:hypothetical protein AAJ76_222000244 [Vairimorpha ceranae]KKO73809.1 hypothetical protein AAJ76_222000244 [Vairimorpha ceranae]